MFNLTDQPIKWESHYSRIINVQLVVQGLRTLHLSSFQTGMDSYCKAILQPISYQALFRSKPSPEQGAEKSCFSGIKVSEGNLHALKNDLSHKLVVHKTIALF